MPIQVSEMASLSNIKSRIEEIEGTPSDRQRLILGGKELLENDKALIDYAIQHGSTFHLIPRHINPHMLFINTALQEGTITLYGLKELSICTISDTKEKIQQQLGIATAQQRLIYGDKLLEDKKTLQDYGITFGSTVHMALHFGT